MCARTNNRFESTNGSVNRTSLCAGKFREQCVNFRLGNIPSATGKRPFRESINIRVEMLEMSRVNPISRNDQSQIAHLSR